MTEPELFAAVGTLHLAPGDALVVTINDAQANLALYESARERLRACYPEHLIIFLWHGATLMSVSPEAMRQAGWVRAEVPA
jgi:hypothetical protein